MMKIYHLAASILSREKRHSMQDGEASSTADAVAHFYVDAEDGTTAAAIAGDFCKARGYRLIDYLTLPATISSSPLNSEEHKVAYKAAHTSGMSVVIALALDENGVPIDLTPSVI